MVCLDASIFLAWLLPEDLSDQADALMARLSHRGERILVPLLVTPEVLSGLRRAVYRKRVTAEHGESARVLFEKTSVALHDLLGLAESAWGLGKSLNAASLHDMFYLALAEREECDLWTGDKRLIGLLDSRFPRVKYLGDLSLDDQPA